MATIVSYLLQLVFYEIFFALRDISLRQSKKWLQIPNIILGCVLPGFLNSYYILLIFCYIDVWQTNIFSSIDGRYAEFAEPERVETAWRHSQNMQAIWNRA